jgi:hypothetical protein
LNDLNERIRQDVKVIQIWHRIEHVVVLDKIMRQKDDPLLIEILKRLRKGLCTEEEKEVLDKYVLSSEECIPETKALTDIERWADNPGQACPLIVYTNVARDRHNLNMAEAFATAIGQGCHVYHSRGQEKSSKGGQGVPRSVGGGRQSAVESADPVSTHGGLARRRSAVIITADSVATPRLSANYGGAARQAAPRISLNAVIPRQRSERG